MYVWQMNDGTWRISLTTTSSLARVRQIPERELDGWFETKAAAIARMEHLKNKYA